MIFQSLPLQKYYNVLNNGLIISYNNTKQFFYYHSYKKNSIRTKKKETMLYLVWKILIN